MFAIYAALGVASYGFPFASIRSAMTRVALRTLQEFASIIPREVPEHLDDDSIGGKR